MCSIFSTRVDSVQKQINGVLLGHGVEIACQSRVSRSLDCSQIMGAEDWKQPLCSMTRVSSVQGKMSFLLPDIRIISQGGSKPPMKRSQRSWGFGTSFFPFKRGQCHNTFVSQSIHTGMKRAGFDWPGHQSFFESFPVSLYRAFCTFFFFVSSETLQGFADPQFVDNTAQARSVMAQHRCKRGWQCLSKRTTHDWPNP